MYTPLCYDLKSHAQRHSEAFLVLVPLTLLKCIGTSQPERLLLLCLVRAPLLRSTTSLFRASIALKFCLWLHPSQGSSLRTHHAGKTELAWALVRGGIYICAHTCSGNHNRFPTGVLTQPMTLLLAAVISCGKDIPV